VQAGKVRVPALLIGTSQLIRSVLRTMDSAPMKELLQVEDTFLIKGRGLVLAPPLPLPATGTFKTFQGRVHITQPPGHVIELEAVFALEHLLLVGGGRRWDIVVTLPAASRSDVPVGSRVHTSEDVLRVLQGRGQPGTPSSSRIRQAEQQ
jgi:hypothetical protein